MDQLELILVLAGAAVVVLAIVAVFVLPAFGADGRRGGHDSGHGGGGYEGSGGAEAGGGD